MCGRFYVDDDIEDELFEVIKDIDDKYKGLREFNGDVRPTMMSPIIFVNDEGRKAIDTSKWGFSSHNQLLINARAENIYERVNFREPMVNGRCIVPARGFYEWDSSKNQYTFTRKQNKLILLASLYRYEPDSRRFVIITTRANESMRTVHDRMPVVLRTEMVNDWLYNRDAAEMILKTEPEQLEKECKYEQISFDLKNPDTR